mgnify:CR=1 FL=1
MLSTGFPGDQDDRYEDDEVQSCPDCKHDMSLDLWNEWFCEECEKVNQALDS